MKSTDHDTFVDSGCASGVGWRLGSRFFGLTRRFSCSSQ
jgi:hypothetical protein